MSLINNFVLDLAALPALSQVPITAITAVPGADGEAIGVTVSDDFHNLGLGNCRLTKTTTIQVDVYAGTYLRLMAMKDAIIEQYNGASVILTDSMGLNPVTFKHMAVVFSAESATSLNNTVYRAIVSIEART